jgi:hypothetical protein
MNTEFDAYTAICDELNLLSNEEFKCFVFGFMRDSVFDIIATMDLGNVTSTKEAHDWVREHMH